MKRLSGPELRKLQRVKVRVRHGRIDKTGQSKTLFFFYIQTSGYLCKRRDEREANGGVPISMFRCKYGRCSATYRGIHREGTETFAYLKSSPHAKPGCNGHSHPPAPFEFQDVTKIDKPWMDPACYDPNGLLPSLNKKNEEVAKIVKERNGRKKIEAGFKKAQERLKKAVGNKGGKHVAYFYVHDKPGERTSRISKRTHAEWCGKSGSPGKRKNTHTLNGKMKRLVEGLDEKAAANTESICSIPFNVEKPALKNKEYPYNTILDSMFAGALAAAIELLAYFFALHELDQGPDELTSEDELEKALGSYNNLSPEQKKEFQRKTGLEDTTAPKTKRTRKG